MALTSWHCFQCLGAGGKEGALTQGEEATQGRHVGGLVEYLVWLLSWDLQTLPCFQTSVAL